jgi:hypothetical protein
MEDTQECVVIQVPEFGFLNFVSTVSNANWWLTGPIILLAVTRVGV